MNKMRVEGNRTESETVKERGRSIGHSSSHEGSGKVSDFETPGDLLIALSGMRMIGFEAGRTIELRRFEFCRIRLRVRMFFPSDVPCDKIEEAQEKFILEMLDREEKSVLGKDASADVSDECRDILSMGKYRSIGVSYGLTLKSRKNEYESHVVDVMEEMMVSDGEDILEAFDRLADEMAERLNSHHGRIKNSE